MNIPDYQEEHSREGAVRFAGATYDLAACLRRIARDYRLSPEAFDALLADAYTDGRHLWNTRELEKKEGGQ